jgi:hypothetical protein
MVSAGKGVRVKKSGVAGGRGRKNGKQKAKTRKQKGEGREKAQKPQKRRLQGKKLKAESRMLKVEVDLRLVPVAAVGEMVAARDESVSAQPPHLRIGEGGAWEKQEEQKEQRAERGKQKIEIEKGRGRKAVVMPSIMLEGDEPEEVYLHGPGQKYVVWVGQPTEQRSGESKVRTLGRLPESYGSGRLVLVARDPKCLHAQWDLSVKEQQRLNALSRTGHLEVRVYRGSAGGPEVARAGVHRESRGWFMHVDRAGEGYVAELGYELREGTWVAVATSEVTMTPPAGRCEVREDVFVCRGSGEQRGASAEREAGRKAEKRGQRTEDGRIGGESTEEKVERGQIQEGPKGAEAETGEQRVEIEQGGAEGSGQAAGVEWTEEQERALAEFIERSLVRRESKGSEGSGEWVEVGGGKAESGKQIVEIDWDQAEVGGHWEAAMPSSPAPGGQVGPEGFWFNVNAELVIYGATEASAQVTIGGRQIGLRPDGSFSFRFALPDGSHELPVRAVSTDGKEGREVVLKFRRETEADRT